MSDQLSGRAKENAENAIDVDLPSSVEGWLTKVKARKAESTYNKRESHIKRFLRFYRDDLPYDDFDPSRITVLDIEDFLDATKNDGYSAATIKSDYYAVKLYLRYCDRRDLIDATPIPDHELNLDKGGWIEDWDHTEQSSNGTKEDVHYITADEKEKLIEHLPAPKTRNELLVRLMWQTGMRQEEISTINIEDINLKEHSIQIRSSKTSSNDTVWYQPSLSTLIRQWLVDRKRYNTHAETGETLEDIPDDVDEDPDPDTGRLFLTKKKPEMTQTRINSIIRDAAWDAGIQSTVYTDAGEMNRHEVTGHTLRHSFAVQSLKNDIDIKTIKDLMGHEDISVTEKYLEIVDKYRRDSIRMKGPGTEDPYADEEDSA